MGVNCRVAVAILLPPLGASYQSTVSLGPTVTFRGGIGAFSQISLSALFWGASKSGQRQFGFVKMIFCSQPAKLVTVTVTVGTPAGLFAIIS